MHLYAICLQRTIELTVRVCGLVSAMSGHCSASARSRSRLLICVLPIFDLSISSFPTVSVSMMKSGLITSITNVSNVDRSRSFLISATGRRVQFHFRLVKRHMRSTLTAHCPFPAFFAEYNALYIGVCSCWTVYVLKGRQVVLYMRADQL